MAWLARWSLGLLLGVALLMAVAWGALHGWIVPRIGNYRAQLQEQATQVLGVPVRLGTVTARTEGLIPTVELGDVALLDPQGREALRLPRVVLAVSPRSLWKFGFEQLYIDSPELDIRRTPEGRMEGSFFCVAVDGTRFDAPITPFLLQAHDQGPEPSAPAGRVLH